MAAMMLHPQASRQQLQDKVTPVASSTQPHRRGSSVSVPTMEVPAGFYHHTKLDIWMLGLTIVIGGQYFSWNEGLGAGLYSYLICYGLISSAYVLLCCCLSEIVGALPFAGGAYGLARCTLGFYAGFMIGGCEILEYVVYVATSVVTLSEMVVQIAPSFSRLEPLIWLLFYVTALWIQIVGNKVFWRFNLIIGSISLVILVVYFIGVIPYADFPHYSTMPSLNSTKTPVELRFIDGIPGFFHALPITAWFFVGVEALTLAGDQVVTPKATIPISQVACVGTLWVTGLSVFVATVSIPPGLEQISTELFPLNHGFMLLFPSLSYQLSSILTLPATFATAFGFMWCYGKLIAAMAESHLFPYALARKHARYHTQQNALIAGSVLSFLFCILVYLVPSIRTALFPICIMFAFISYIGQCLGYILLHLRFQNVIKTSTFHSPLKIYGALYALVVWLLGLVGVIGFQRHRGLEAAIGAAVMALLTLVYFGYSKKRQVFSTQENQVLLVAHITKYNHVVRKKKANGTGGKKQVSQESTQTRHVSGNRDQKKKSRLQAYLHSTSHSAGAAASAKPSTSDQHASVHIER